MTVSSRRRFSRAEGPVPGSTPGSRFLTGPEPRAGTAPFRGNLVTIRQAACRPNRPSRRPSPVLPGHPQIVVDPRETPKFKLHHSAVHVESFAFKANKRTEQTCQKFWHGMFILFRGTLSRCNFQPGECAVGLISNRAGRGSSQRPDQRGPRGPALILFHHTSRPVAGMAGCRCRFRLAAARSRYTRPRSVRERGRKVSSAWFTLPQIARKTSCPLALRCWP
jgi:hypothetical protein